MSNLIIEKLLAKTQAHRHPRVQPRATRFAFT
jgi:hypothetical protein